MQFTSLHYLLAFGALFLAYWALPHRWRWWLALAASVGFYALFGPGMLCVLAGCVLASWALGLWLSRCSGRRAALALSLAVALAPLLTFKYWDSLSALWHAETHVAALTPVGISFFTFKIVAYLVEVWRGALPAQRNLGRYALYVSFFPEVSSGPIQRPADLLAQIEAPRAFETAMGVEGAELVIWGLFKKMVIANNLAGYVTTAFVTPEFVLGPSVLIGIFLYSIQLYCDFSGYSDIAIGCMRMLGYTVPENFRTPYFSLSIRDFWARWHISLSSWLRDYVYFPLGGSRKGTARTCINLMLTFFVSGLWHGTGLQFLVWGLLHGAYQVAGRLTRPLRSRLWALCRIREDSCFARAVKVAVTFCLVSFAWLFFGAGSLSQAGVLLARIPYGFTLSVQTLKNALAMLNFNPTMLARMAGVCGVLTAVDFCSRHCGFSAWLGARKGWFRYAFSLALVLCILFLAPASGGSFIYFQF